jgi:hypothetical protein
MLVSYVVCGQSLAGESAQLPRIEQRERVPDEFADATSRAIVA